MSENVAGNWIKLNRKITNHWIWNNPVYLKAWLQILMEVNHADKPVLINGRLIVCKRGQKLYSLNTWVKELGGDWTLGRFRIFIKLLKSDMMVTTEGLQKTTRLTVCNYSTYQDRQHANDRQTTFSSEHPNDRQTTTIEEYKHFKKQENNIHSAREADFSDSNLPDSNFNRASEIPEPQNTDDSVMKVVEHWGNKIQKDITAIPSTVISHWSSAVAIHGVDWCIDAIDNAESIHVGSVIFAAEKKNQATSQKSANENNLENPEISDEQKRIDAESAELLKQYDERQKAKGAHGN